MNVWKYIYIKFFKIRRRIIGKDGADDFAAMLFVASFDSLLYFGILILIDMCKGDAFERIRKEVEAEPRKMLWGILSILYMIFVVFFFLFCCYVGKYGLRFLEPL